MLWGIFYNDLICVNICKICHMAYISKTDRQLAERFLEHLIGIHKEALKPDSLYFSNPDHQDEAEISFAALKFSPNDQVTC